MSQRKKSGFTLIEMMLAMGFVSLLLLAIATIGVQLGQMYHKGLVLNGIDQVNRTIYADLQSAFEGTPQNFLLNTANNYIIQPGAAPTATSGQTGGGRLCLGQYSYVWNNGIGTAVTGTRTPTNTYDDAGATTFSLAQTYDPTGAMCRKVGSAYPAVPLPTATNPKTTDLLETTSQDTGTTGGTGNRSMALQYLSIEPSNQTAPTDIATGQSMYVISYALGTNSLNTLTQTNNFYTCQDPTVLETAFQFCAVENFTIAVRGGYGVN